MVERLAETVNCAVEAAIWNKVFCVSNTFDSDLDG